MRLGNLKSLTRVSRGNTSLLLLIALLALLVAEGFVVKRSVNVIMASQSDPINLKQAQGVRINFAAYDTVAHYLQTANNYQASTTFFTNPFFVSTNQQP